MINKLIIFALFVFIVSDVIYILCPPKHTLCEDSEEIGKMYDWKCFKEIDEK
jgi:hypothetical protein